MRVAKNRIRNQKSRHALGRPTYVQSRKRPSLPRKRVHPTWLLSEQPEPQTIVARRRTGIRIIALATQKLVCEPMAVRSQSSSGNCSTQVRSHFRRSHDLPARATGSTTSTREINYCFSPLGWLRRAGMSHPLGSLRRTVTLSSLVVLREFWISRDCRAKQGLRSQCILSMGIKSIYLALPEALPFAESCQSW